MSFRFSSFPPFHFFTTISLLLLSACGPNSTPQPTSTWMPTEISTIPQPTIGLPTQTPYIITTTPELIANPSSTQGVFFLSLMEGNNFHIYAYSPQTITLTRLTADAWDDITPAVSPDGNWLVFSSRRNGYWDLYLMDLIGGTTQQLTDTLSYEAAPSWSPDGKNIAYESYTNGNLDIFFLDVTNPDLAPTQLTQLPATDTSPAWSPLGRQIAFISNRSGEPEVWIADLDQGGNVLNISNNPSMVEAHPAWSPDGSKLAWAATNPDSGLTGIYIWDARSPNSPVEWAGSGDWPVWQNNFNLASRFPTPNETYLTGYTITHAINIPPIQFPGAMNGLSFGSTNAELPGVFEPQASFTPDPIFLSGNLPQQIIPTGRASLVNLSNVTALNPQLSELASNSFQALRAVVLSKTGWDALGNLENAYVPLTTSLDPGLGEDWLFTGRAFTLNPVLMQANWANVVRDDFGQQIYWRIYLRTAAQDGSQGRPLTEIPWDFSARTTSSTAYENGGQLMNSVPDGYWFDLTALAAQYGWERLPALANWRTYYTGAHFNEFYYPQGLDWRKAMLQLYPLEVLVTPTIVIPPTRTPTRTSPWYRSPTPTWTSTTHPTLTINP
jgi:TolB protein